MEVLVFGAGSLGSLIGGLLAREHDVTLIGREPHVRAIREKGLRLTGRVDRTVRPAAATAVDPSADPDLAVVTVKSFDTGAAARELARCDPEAVLSLQNGMGNEATLAEHLDAPVLAGTTTWGAHTEDPGVVACTGVGSVTVGPWEASGSAGVDETAGVESAERAGEAFRRAGIETTVVADPRPHLWEKLAVNAGINPVTALARVRNGALVDGPAADLAARAATETAAVAREQGIDLPDARATGAVRQVAETTAANRSSMLADVESGRRTEIDAINGYVVDHAGGDVPVNAALAGLIRAWEAGETLR
ncbi:MAG: ketopantoate reductase family protein [Halobacteriales archaeon]